MNEPLYRKGDEVEIVRRGVIVEVDPKDPARFGIGRPDGFGADAYFRTDDDKVRHRLVTVAEPTADTTEHPDACTRCRRVVEHLHVFESRPGVPFCADCAAEMLAAGGMKPEKTIADELREAAARVRETGARAREATVTGHGDEWLPWEVVTAHVQDIANLGVPGVPTGGAFVAHPAYRHDREEAWHESRFLTKEVPAPVAEWMALVHPGLAEPLASWLERAAVWADETTVPVGGLVFHHACGGVVGQEVRRCECFDHPLAVARVLNGTPQEAPRV